MKLKELTDATLIGLCGPARAGKDTAADYMMADWGVMKYNFALPIKLMLGRGMGLTEDELYGKKKERPLERLGLNKSPREIMQTLGTEWGRDCVDESLWLKLGMAEWEKCRAHSRSLVVADVRFPNEAEWIRKHGVLIHIERADAPAVAAHSSEGGIAWEGGDLRLVNNDSVENLHLRIDHFMRMVDDWRISTRKRAAAFKAGLK